MTLILLKDAMIIIALGFLVVFLAFGIRIFLTAQKAITNVDKSINEIKDCVVSAKVVLIPTLENFQKTLNETRNNLGNTLENINQLAIASKSSVEFVQNNVAASLENIDKFVTKFESIAEHFDTDVANIFDTLNKISNPLKNAVKTIVSPIRATTRFSRAAKSAINAFTSRLSLKNKSETEV